MAVGLGAAGLDGLLPAGAHWTAASGPPKPAPAGLRCLATVLEAPERWCLGDPPDDAVAARRFQLSAGGGLRFAGILGGAPGMRAQEICHTRRVEVIATTTRALLGWLAAAPHLADRCEPRP